MKAITLHQPWASAIALGYKTIETRTHNRFACLVSQRIAIHAGKAWGHMAEWMFERWGGLSRWDIAQIVAHANEARGAIVATADVLEHRRLSAAVSRHALCDCGDDDRPLFGLVLGGVDKLRHPIPCNGFQGIWHVDPDIAVALAIDAEGRPL